MPISAFPGRMSGAVFAITLAAAPLWAGTIPENLKGTGEVVVTSGGGSWEEAQRKAFFDPFTRDTGIRVVLVPEDHAKLLASVQVGQPEADITSVPAGNLAGFLARNAVSKIDYGFFAPETLAAMPEPMKAEYGVGALLYSVAVAYNTDTFPGDNHPKTWADLYDLKKFPGKRSLAKCEKIVDGGLLEGALMADGVAPADLYPLDMDRAFAKIEEIKPDVARWWIAGADAPQALIDGSVDVAAAYNGRVFGAQKEGAPIALSWDQSLLQYDYWVVTAGSPNATNAAKFLAYISRPEPQAAFAEAIAYGPVNNDAYKLLPAAMLSILPGSPEIAPKQVFQNYAWWNAVDAEGRSNWEKAMERCVSLLSN